MLRFAVQRDREILHSEPSDYLLIRDALRAAEAIIDLCETIEQRIGLAPASYATEFTSCRAAMLVLIAATLSAQLDSNQEYLTKGMRLIETLSSSYGQASKEAREIISLEKAVNKYCHEPTHIKCPTEASAKQPESVCDPWIGGDSPAEDDGPSTIQHENEDMPSTSAFPEVQSLDDDWNKIWNDLLQNGVF